MQVRCEPQLLVALTLDKETAVLIGYEIGWSPEIMQTMWRRFPGLPPRSPVTVPTELPRLWS